MKVLKNLSADVVFEPHTKTSYVHHARVDVPVPAMSGHMFQVQIAMVRRAPEPGTSIVLKVGAAELEISFKELYRLATQCDPAFKPSFDQMFAPDPTSTPTQDNA